jgi:hypothetical protein
MCRRTTHLSHARLSNQHRVVLGAPRQDLNAASYLLITTYDRVQLAVASSLSIRCFCVSVFVGGRKGACVHVCVCACPHHGL